MCVKQERTISEGKTKCRAGFPARHTMNEPNFNRNKTLAGLLEGDLGEK